MIVRAEGDDLILITQPDHAGLAGRIMDGWRADGLPDRPSRPTVLLATHEHDNGWIEEDAWPRLDPDTGRPHDFITMPDEVKQAIWPRAVARIAEMDPQSAALIAQHALTVYDRHRTSPGWGEFFDQMERLREELRDPTRGGPIPESFLADYAIVFLGDLLSLIFCNGWTDPVEAEGYRLILRGRRLEVSPDPFGGGIVPLRVPARRLSNRYYGSEADLREALTHAEQLWLTGQASGPGSS